MKPEQIYPYEPPKAPLDVVTPRGLDAPALWNPNVAVVWSIILTPAFGAFIHAQNWDALGEERNASIQRRWAWIYISALLFRTILYFTATEMRTMIFQLDVLDYLYLFCWYLLGARPQIELVNDKFGDTYPRHAWRKPVTKVVGIILASIVCMMLVATAINKAG